MTGEKPKILITAPNLEIGPYGDYILDNATALSFEAIRHAGGDPDVITSQTDEDSWADKYYEADGIVLGGGEDLHPDSFGHNVYSILAGQPGLLEERPDLLGETAPDRDRLEIWILERALRDDMPVEAICRGSQMLNAYLGGTLHLDLSFELGHGDINHRLSKGPEDRTKLAHGVHLESDSLTATELGVTYYEVNSYHHMGVERAGSGIYIVGWAEDGVAEKMEMRHKRHVRGSQYHPESLAMIMPIIMKQFEVFVDASYEFRMQQPGRQLAQAV